MSDSLSALRLPFVRSFALGRAFAVLGGQVLSTAVGWELYRRTRDPWSLGLVGLFELIPVLVFLVASGHVADRVPRRRVAMAAHGLHALAALGLAESARRGAPTSWIYGCLLLVGTARSFAAPSVGTILPQLLTPPQLLNANAWMAAILELATIVGPAVGGLLIAGTEGVLVAYVFAAASQAVFVVCLTFVPLRPPPPASPTRGLRHLFAGFGFVRRTPVFLAAITLDLFGVLLGGAVALLPVFAEDILHVGARGLGWLRAAPAVGALAMALAITRMRPWRRPGRALLVAVTGFGLSTVGFGLSTHLGLSLLCLALTGVFDTVSVVIRVTLGQVLTPDGLRGRVAALTYVFIGLSNELGAFESGAVASFVGTQASVVLGGLGTLGVVAVVASVWPQLARIGPLDTLRPTTDVARAAGGGAFPPAAPPT